MMAPNDTVTFALAVAGLVSFYLVGRALFDLARHRAPYRAAPRQAGRRRAPPRL